jgi:hypothetical protein
MTTMRSVEPPAGIDAIMARLLPFLSGTPPRPGEHGSDRHGRIHVWDPGRGWIPTAEIQHAEAKWNLEAEP